MDTFLLSIKEIHTIKEAKELLFETLTPKTDIVYRALDLAITAHDGQIRKSGEPYVVHPILVAAITASISGEETMVAASLLHDVVEDTEYTIEYIEQEFGHDIFHIVGGLTKIVEMRDEKLIPSGSGDRLINSALSFRKMLIASIKDVRTCDQTL